MPWLQHDSVSLFYEEVPGETPDGAAPLVFVHGLGCDLGFFAPQFDAFAGAHRLVAIDLRGHGRSDKPRQAYTIPAFAEELAWALDALAVQRPVVVGHSMGGAIGLELAAQQPERLAGLVMLDTSVLPAANVWAGVRPIIDALKSPAYAPLVRKFFAEAFFLPTDDAGRRQALVEAMLATPQHVLASALENIYAWDSAAAARRCRVPALYIGATHPRGDVARLAEACPTLVHGQVVGSGHFLQLEVPDQVNAMIRRFLTTCLPAAVSNARAGSAGRA